jgi:DNA-binding transcriptional LysR family regulator
LLESLFILANNAVVKTRRIEALWSHVHWLGVLAATGSYTAAAQRLGVSKAAMSQRIAELEQAAGVSLVRRTTRSVRLTEAGEQLVEATRAAYEQIERSFVSVKDLAAAPGGLLRVTAPVAFARQQLAPLIAPFLKQYPTVRLELEQSDRLSVLSQEGFDLAIRHATSVPDTYVAWSLCETRSLLVATRGYLRRHGTPSTPADLARHNCLYYLRSSSDTPTWGFQSVKGTGGARLSVPIQGSFSANNSETLRDAALGGIGIALLPDFSAQRELASGKLVQVLPGWLAVGAFGDRLYAIRPYSPYVPRAVQVFVAYLREALSAGFNGPPCG